MADEMNPRLQAWLRQAVKKVRLQPYYKGFKIGLKVNLPGRNENTKPTVRVWRIKKEKNDGDSSK